MYVEMAFTASPGAICQKHKSDLALAFVSSRMVILRFCEVAELTLGQALGYLKIKRKRKE
jgi:hypothetical protein